MASKGEETAEVLPTGAPLGVKSYAKRNIVAKGMSRFEGIAKVAPPQPDIERLSERVINILAHNPSPYTLNGTNCYLVGTGSKRILIDTGEWGRGQPEFLADLEKCMSEVGCTGLSMILITHMHGDHFGGVEGLQKKFGPVRVGMLPVPDHQLSIFTIKNIKSRGLEEVVKNGPKQDFSRPGGPKSWEQLRQAWEASMPQWPDEDLSWDWAGRTKMELQRDYWYMVKHAEFYERWEAGVIPSVVLEDGQHIKTEGATLRVMATPGHAENHATFVLEEERALFSGDHVLGFGTTNLSDLHEYMRSLRMMQAYVSANQPEFAGILYPGHGPHIQDGMDLLTRYVVHRDAREAQVYDFLKVQPAEDQYMDGTLPTALNVAQALYTHTEVKKLNFARENVEKILVKLYRERKAECYRLVVERGQKRPDPLMGAKYQHVPLPPGYLRRLDIDIAWKLLPNTPTTTNSAAAL
jgi:glyoxylase-like metal-dependent hydrolase (beta-lactamase superfamily II)